jgi:hypothetical protein
MHTYHGWPPFFRQCERKETPDVLIGLQMYNADPASGRRQRAAGEALARLRGVEGVNLQFRRGPAFEFPGLATAPVLERDSVQATRTPGRRRPLTSDVFDALWRAAAAGRHRYFAYVNADIVVTEAAVTAVNELGLDTCAIGRTDVDDITRPAPGPILTAGIDMFAVATAWWPRHRHRFRPYIVGEGCWDVVYTAIMMAHSRGLVLNREPLIFHERHDPAWHGTTPEAQHNGFLAALDARYFSIWCGYWEALEAARRRGASVGEETVLQCELLAWRRSLRDALRQIGRSVRARVNHRRLRSSWPPLSAAEL